MPAATVNELLRELERDPHRNHVGKTVTMLLTFSAWLDTRDPSPAEAGS